MAVLDQLRAMEQQVERRLRELEPLVNEYHELKQVAQRLGLTHADGQPSPSRARRPPAAAERPSPTVTAKGTTAARSTTRRPSRRRAGRRRKPVAPGSRQQDVL